MVTYLLCTINLLAIIATKYLPLNGMPSFIQNSIMMEKNLMRLLTKILKNLLILTTEDFKCNSCTKVFRTKDSLLNHEKSGHTENVPLLEDSNCKLSKETEVDFSKETEVNLSKETEVFCTKDSLLNHEKSVHTENVPLFEDFKCNSCTKVFSDELPTEFGNAGTQVLLIANRIR